MKTKKNFTVVALAILVFAGVASAGQPTEPRTTVVPVQSGTVIENLPTVNLRDVATEVVPEVVPGARTVPTKFFEVNPSSIDGKRLILPSIDGSTNAVTVCIGVWFRGICIGVLVDTYGSPRPRPR